MGNKLVLDQAKEDSSRDSEVQKSELLERIKRDTIRASSEPLSHSCWHRDSYSDSWVDGPDWGDGSY